MAQTTALCDATILTGEATVEGHALLVHNGRIEDIVANQHIPADARRISCAGQILAPGLIDAQVNGGGNHLLNNEPTVEACLAIAAAHRRYGTTSLLLTCISDQPEIARKAAAAVREARKQDQSILGIHFEGPHLSAERRGVHNAVTLRQPDDNDLRLYRREGDEVMLITLAPEKVDAAILQQLSKQTIVALGHTDAAPEQIRKALASGATGFTHLFNGMGGMSAREPGVTGVALDDRDNWCGLIADGHHVAPEMIRLALRAKPQGKIFLVSDAMAPAATDDPKPFLLYNKEIQFIASTVSFPSRLREGLGAGQDVSHEFQSLHLRQPPRPPSIPPASGREATAPLSKCVTQEGSLAGSAITLLDAVRYCVQTVKVELDEALRMASTYPAAFLGIDKQRGKLLPGYKADIIALDQNLQLQQIL
jgi:N-acetylglucosamine-6-phosphate deacetylase